MGLLRGDISDLDTHSLLYKKPCYAAEDNKQNQRATLSF